MNKLIQSISTLHHLSWTDIYISVHAHVKKRVINEGREKSFRLHLGSWKPPMNEQGSDYCGLAHYYRSISTKVKMRSNKFLIRYKKYNKCLLKILLVYWKCVRLL